MRAVCTVDRVVERSIGTCAAVLLAAEVVLLAASVIARYGLHRPLLWSDELTTMLLLWVFAFGAAMAERQVQHLRLTTLVDRASPRIRDAMDTGIILLTACFALTLIRWGVDYVADEMQTTSPGLGIAAGWRAAALPALGIMLLESVTMRVLVERRGAIGQLAAFGVIALVGISLWLGSDILSDWDVWNLPVFFGVLLVGGLLIGVPIGICFALSTLLYLWCTTDTPLTLVLARIDGGISDSILLSIPLFVLLGKMMEATGMAEALVHMLARLVGRARGGMSYALLGGMFLVSGISGAKTADMAAVAPVLFGEMRRRGNSEGEMVALLAASAVMSETIPPSLVLIAIATTAGVSIAALFTAGIIPALVAAIALCVVVRLRAPQESVRIVERGPGFGRLFARALPGLVLPFLVRAAVVDGVATATEVSTLGIAYTAIVALVINRHFPWRRLVPMLVETAVLSGALLLILGAADGMAWALIQSGLSDTLGRTLGSLPGGGLGFLLATIPVFVVFGSFLEGLPAIALFGPLLFPIARTLGVHDVQFAMVAILSMGIGLYMPPFGVGYYSACAIGGVPPGAAMRQVWPYLGVLLLVTILIAAVPAFSTVLLP